MEYTDYNIIIKKSETFLGCNWCFSKENNIDIIFNGNNQSRTIKLCRTHLVILYHKIKNFLESDNKLEIESFLEELETFNSHHPL